MSEKFLNFNDDNSLIVRSEATNNKGSCQFNNNLLPLSFQNEKSKYGISKNSLKIAKLKLKKQKEFLTSNTFTNPNSGEIKSFLDVSFAANFSTRYYAEISNRVNTIQSFQIIQGQIPIFLTITLNGCFRDALKGDFSRFKPKDKQYLPVELKYKIKHNESFSIRDLVIALNYQWHLFIMRLHRKYNNLEKSYIRAFEPHKKDGVPHIHALVNIPAYAFEYAFKIYKDIFYAPQNLKNTYLPFNQKENGEINGFQWTLNNPTGYVMKYIQKTFLNVEKNEKLTELSAWYIVHKVRRFLTSRNPVPLWIYRKINFFFKDYYHLNDYKKNYNCTFEWSFQKDYFFMKNYETDEEMIYLNGRLEYYLKGKLLKFYDKLKPDKNYSTSFRIKDKILIKTKNKMKFIPIYENNIKIGFLNNGIFYDKNSIPISKMKNYQLYNYFKKLNIEKCNLQHYGFVKNLLIERGVLEEEKQSLNNYNMEFEKCI